MKITAAVARDAGGPFSIEQVVLEEPRQGEILVRVVATGLCHTDLVVRDQILPTPLPAVLGHEGAGVVEKVGPGVTSVAPGDNVVIGFASCGHCPNCSDHQPGYCVDFMGRNFGGARPDGSKPIQSLTGEPISSSFFGQSSFATHALATEDNVVKVPKDLQLELLGPLGCGLMTGAGAVLNYLKPKAGSSVAVFGGGPVGLAAVMAAAALGATTVILVEPVAARRELALSIGATHAVDPTAGNPADQIRAISPAGIDRVLDTSGVMAAIEAGISVLGSRAMLGFVGVPNRLDAALTVPVVPLMVGGSSIKGITEGDSDPKLTIPALIELNKAGKFPFEKLITLYPLEKINEAIDDQYAGRCVKAVLTM